MIEGYIIYMVLVYIGITLGYHRYFSHKEFVTSDWQQIVMLSCGAICGGRDPFGWVGIHRMHHAYSDTSKDPQPTGWRAFFSIWPEVTIPRKFVKDLYRNRILLWFHKHHKWIWIGSIFVIGWENWLWVQFFSWLGFGMINYFGHKNGQPVNAWGLNIIAPGEGSHKDHHG